MPRWTPPPRLRTVSPNVRLASWVTASRLRVEVHITPCIVTSPPAACSARAAALVNPANERLQGTQFTPSECNWRLAPGTTLIYPPQVVDGIVSELGGAALAEARAALPADSDDVRCQTGHAVVTAAFGELVACYDLVVHACAPFYDRCRREDWLVRTMSCYHAAFDAAAAAGASTLAVPLLGAGARGAPTADAAEAAVAATTSWAKDAGVLRAACFGVQQEEVALALADRLDAVLSRDVECSAGG